MKILKKLFGKKPTQEQKLKLSFLEGQLNAFSSLYGIIDEEIDEYVGIKQKKLLKKIDILKEQMS
jgi:hypothetical protein